MRTMRARGLTLNNCLGGIHNICIKYIVEQQQKKHIASTNDTELTNNNEMQAINEKKKNIIKIG